MIHFDWKCGERIELDDMAYAVERRVPTGVQFVAIGDGTVTTISDVDLFKAFEQGRLRRHIAPSNASPVRLLNPPARDFTAFPEKQRKTAIARCRLVDALLAECGTLEMGNAALATAIERVRSLPDMPKHLSISTVRRLIRAHKAAPGPLGKGDVLSNVPGQRGPRRRRIDGHVRLLIDEGLAKHWLKLEPDQLQAIYWRVEASVAAENRHREQGAENGKPVALLKMPSLATFYRIVAEYDDRDRIKKQDGARASRNAYRQDLKTYEEHVPMGVLEIDHTPVDVTVVDANDLVLGRPTLTIAIDRCSRMVVAFVLHWEGESYAAIMMTLRHAIRPKTYVREMFGDKIKNEWPCWGLPFMICIDNGTAGHSHNLDAACESLGNIAIDYTETRRPQHKAKVERVFSTFNSYLFHALPGASLVRGRDSDYNPATAARIELHALNLAFHRMIIDFYNSKYHHGLRDIPIDVWRAGIEKHKPRTPSHIDDLDVLSSGSKTRLLTNQGIRIFGLRYNVLALEMLRVEAKGDVTVNVRYDPTDITKIQVHDAVRARYINVECLDADVHGLSLWQWNAIRQRQVEKKKNNDRSGIWSERNAIVDELAEHSKKHGNRKRGKRHAARHHSATATPDQLASREPIDLKKPPPAHALRGRIRGNRLTDYTTIPDLPPAAVKATPTAIPDLPLDNDGFNTTQKNPETPKPVLEIVPHGPGKDARNDDSDFEEFLSKNPFTARRHR